jgi:outer membrane lipoprotein-sorting protein
MHHRQGKALWILLVLALFAVPVGAAAAAEFSAVIVTKSGGEERQSKIYIKGDKIRREYVNPAGTTIFIVPGDKKIMWMLDSVTLTYSELPFDKDASPKALNLPKDGGGGKLVGTETLNGYATDKYQTSIKTPTGTRSGTMWFAKKLGVPLKIETDDKLFVQEYKDIKEGRVDDALFAMPSGYRKNDMPPASPKNK